MAEREARLKSLMAWVRLDDGYPEHPKVDKVGPLAAWLNVCAWAYCARNLTDGFVPDERVGRLADVPKPRELAARLVDAKLWERIDGGYLVHDFLDYNPSRADVEANREHLHSVRQAAGRAGGLAKARQTASNGLANTQQVASDVPAMQPSKTLAPYPSRTHPNTQPIPDTPSGANAPSPPQAGKRQRRVTVVNEAFVERMHDEWDQVYGSRAHVGDEIDQAMSHKARLKCTDERAYLRNWLRRGVPKGKAPPLRLVEDCLCEYIRACDAKGAKNGPRQCPEHGYQGRAG